MGALQELDVKTLAIAAGVKVSPEDLPVLTVRLNGLMDMARILESLPLADVEPVLTLLTQKEG